jgi:agmatine/peptidylarginine deiminase
MIRRNKRKPLHLPLILLLVPSLPASAQTQTTTPAQYKANDVVIVSLEGLSPRAELHRRVRDRVMGNADAERNAEKHILEIQMNIVRETAKFGPVLLLAPDEATKSAVNERCNEFQICELLKSDRVRIKVVAHDGVWVRDFGPQIGEQGNTADVVHWRYFDVRAEEAKEEKFQELETARLKLLETRQQEEQPDALTQDSTPEARKAVASTIDDKLYLLRQYSEILKEASPQRTNDDNSAFDIADAVLATPDFYYKSSPLALDGGNLLKLEDGRCLTTRALRSRNKDQNLNVDEEFEKTGGCKAVTLLESLPGPVLEHVDLFVLPGGGKRILLASYDLKGPFAREYWGTLSSAERDLAMNADMAMKLNTERLKSLGYEVIPVVSPFPRIPPNGHTYYPSVLNALVRTGTDGSRQILLPSYKDYESDLQVAALQQIRAAFGPQTEIATIEATEAAKGQGAVHCLTLTAPLRLSIFGVPEDAAMRAEIVARKEELDRAAAAEVEAQIPASGLQGLWAIREGNEQADKSALELYPQRIFFGQGEFQKGVFDQLETRGKYKIEKKDPATWTLRFVFADEKAASAIVQWISRDEVRLAFGDGEDPLVLRRMDSKQVSPFKAEKQSARQNGGAKGNSKPAPVGLEPVP